MGLLFIASYTAWLLSEILLNRLLRSGSGDKQEADKNSLLLIWVTVVASIIAAVFISMRFQYPMYSNAVFSYAGLVIIFAGMLLRFAAVRSLGKFFTVDVTIRQNHKLKKSGMYKYLRHPSYFASLLSFIGFGISLNNWLSLLLVVVAVTTVFIIRIKIEEKVLTDQFGDEYLEYKKSTRGFIPFIY